MFRYDVSRPLLYQIKAHCRASKIAMGSCNVLYTTLSKTIKSLHCREDDCPTQGYIDFPLNMQDVMTIYINDQQHNVDFSTLQIGTACETYNLKNKSCKEFKERITDYQNYVFVNKKDKELDILKQYKELMNDKLKHLFNGRNNNNKYMIQFDVCHGISNQRLSMIAALSLTAEMIEFISYNNQINHHPSNNIQIKLPNFLGYYITNHDNFCNDNVNDCVDYDSNMKNVKPEDLFDIEYMKSYLEEYLGLHILTNDDFLIYSTITNDNNNVENNYNPQHKMNIKTIDFSSNILIHPTSKWNHPLNLIKIFQKMISHDNNISTSKTVTTLNFECMLQTYRWETKRQLEYRKIIVQSLKPSIKLNQIVNLFVEEIHNIIEFVKNNNDNDLDFVIPSALHIREKEHWLEHCNNEFSKENGYEDNDCYLSNRDIVKKMQFLGHVKGKNSIIYIASGNQNISLKEFRLHYPIVITKKILFENLSRKMKQNNDNRNNTRMDADGLLQWYENAAPMVRAQLDYALCTHSIFKYFYGNYYSSMSHMIKEDRLYNSLSSFYLNGRNDGYELNWFEFDF
eukprot:g4586.t1